MEYLNGYNENEVNWHKSVSEISKFLIDHLDKLDFYNFINGEEVDQEKEARWHERIEELCDKATKRLGYQIDRPELMKQAYYQIVNDNNKGLLAQSKVLEHFCSNVEELIQKGVLTK